MRKCIILLIIASFILFLNTDAPAANSGAHKPQLAIISFVPKNIEVTHLIETIPIVLITAIEQTGYFEIVEKKKTDSTIELLGHKITDMKADELFSISRKLGVDFSLWGDMSKSRGTITANIRLYDINSQSICAEHTIETSEGELSAKLRALSSAIVKNAEECKARDMAYAAEKAGALEPPQDVIAKGGLKKIILRWSHKYLQNLSGFKIFRAKDENGPFSQVDTVVGTTFTDEGLSINETFYYRIKAVSKAGFESAFSQTVTAKTSITPMPPIFLNVLPDIKSAHLQWYARPSRGAETETVKYKIYRKSAEESEMKEVGTVSAENTTYTDRNLKDNTTYSYALTALNANNSESDMCTVLEVKTNPPDESLIAESGKIRRVNLKWNIYPHAVAEGYKIYRSTDKTAGYKQIAQIKDRITNTYLDTEGLADKTTYWYRISVYNKDGLETDGSAPVSATTRGQPPTPVGLAAKSNEPRKATLRWNLIQSPDDEIRKYIIYRAAGEKGEYKKITEADPGTSLYIDDNPPLKDFTTYFYKISSSNSVDVMSLFSEPVSATTKPVPQTPKGVKAKSGEVKQVTLSWEPNPEKDIKEYVIYRRTAEEKELDKLKTVRGVSTYIDAGLKDGSEYIYAVQAIDNDSLESPLSSHITAVTKPRPKKPAGLKIADQNGKKTLSWELNPEKDVKQYNVYKKGFLDIPQKITTVQGNSWVIDETRAKLELFVTALDETGLESEDSAVIVFEIKK
jgi:fibronectin type 3 domain-containing protein/TolB-like protein